MVKRCCVFGCKSEWSPYNNISFHKFPLNKYVRSKWLDVLTICSRNEHRLVCGLHFKKDDFMTKSKTKRLKPEAIPSCEIDIVPEGDDCDVKSSASDVESDRFDGDYLFVPPSPSNDSEEIEDVKDNVARPTEGAFSPMLPVTTKYIMCRICLAKEEDKRLYHMAENNLLDLYEQVTNVEVGESRPQHVCWECGHHLRRYVQFRNRALQAHSLLQKLPGANSYMLISNKLKNHFTSKLKIASTKTQADFEYVFSDIKEEEQEYNSDSSGHNTEYLEDESIDGEKIYLEIDEPDIKAETGAFDTLSNIQNEIRQDGSDDEQISSSLDYTKTNTETNDSTKDNSDDEVLPTIKYIKTDTRQNKDLLSILNSSTDMSNVTSLVKKKIICATDTLSMLHPIESIQNVDGVSNSYVQKRIVLNKDIIDITELSHEEQMINLLKKMDNRWYKDAAFQCTMCFKGFVNEDMYNSHMVRHNKRSGQYQCEVCKLRFRLPSLLKYHSVVEHAMSFSCKKCSFVTSRRRVAKQHESFHNGATYQCPYCPRTFGKVTTYFTHIRIKHPSDSACEQCGYMFLGAKGVEIHKKMKHRYDQAPLEGPYCKDCDVKFATEEAHERHLRLSSKHSGDGDADRNRTFSHPVYQGLMKRRVRSQNETNRKRRQNYPTPLECEQCGVEVPNMQTYSQHFRRSHPGRKRVRYPIKRVRHRKSCMCEQCGKTFHSPCLLRHHMWVHGGGGKPYSCEVCGKTFTQKSSLASHRLAHDTPPAARPTHACPDCGKHFATRYNMVKHTFIHTGLKPFECESCGKCFRTVHQRQAHFDHVHLNKPWPARPDRHRRRQAKLEQAIED